MKDKIVTRFAPSPTGYLHLGGARTAFYNWLYAKKNDGKFILRVEDTDVERSTAASTQAIMDSMKWLGLDWDEGPYYQSERLAIYNEKLEELKTKGWVYPAFESKEELETLRTQALLEKRNPIYPRTSLKLSKDEVQSRIERGDAFSWRFKVPDDGYTEIPELIMGGAETRIKNDTMSDFIITRPGTRNSPGMPLYNFVCSIDDNLMGITHVIRGVEHFTNAARQVLIHKALGEETPQFAHLPIITKNGKKMSKRDTDADKNFPVSVMERKALGYLPDATLNHLALLGWSHPEGKEILKVADILEAFDLARVNKSNANFSEEKYFFYNSHYLNEKDDQELVQLVKPYLEKAGFDLEGIEQSKLEKMVNTCKKQSKILSEYPQALKLFFIAPTAFEEGGVKKDLLRTDVNVSDVITAASAEIANIACFDKEHIQAALHSVTTKVPVSFKIMGPILRLALSGSTRSPGLAEMMEILEMPETLRRLKYCQDFINSRISIDNEQVLRNTEISPKLDLS